MELQNRADGLWAKMKWTDEGRALIENGNYKFLSPVWNAREAGRENGRPIYIPESLLSLSLTNLPNLPLPPLANEQNHMKKLTEILKINEDATPEAICAAAETLANQVATHQTEATTLQNTLTTHASELSNATQRAGALQTKLIHLILSNAIRDNRITLAERERWQTDLTGNFDAKSAELETLAPKLNTQSVTCDLGNQKAMYDTEATRRAALTAFVSEQMVNGLSYDEAWANAKRDRAEIFASMARA